MNNLLIIVCKWYINTFKNLPIIVLINREKMNSQYLDIFILITKHNKCHILRPK